MAEQENRPRLTKEEREKNRHNTHNVNSTELHNTTRLLQIRKVVKVVYSTH